MPFVIPIFIPHQGCPQQCLFCNQHSITGKVEGYVRSGVARAMDGERATEGKGDVVTHVAATIREWLARPRRQKQAQGMDAPGNTPAEERPQVAFFGGSFTCLPRTHQEAFLAAVQPFLQSGEVGCIRLSTRPDCVDEEVGSFLWSRGVRIVELGVQSLDDRVLLASRRGHTAEHSRMAVALLQEAGMEVGMQLLPGLPLETTGSFLRTVREVAVLAPAFVRLYPVLVIEHAGLANMYRRGEYRPLSMNRAIALTCRAKGIMEAAGIRVVRIGLQPSPALERELLAGPYHPAFGELVAARIWFKKIRALLAGCPEGKRVTVRIAPRDLSAVIGLKRSNMQRFEQLGLGDRLEMITDMNMKRGTLEYAVN